MPTAAEMLSADFGFLPDVVRQHAAEQPDRLAIVVEDRTLTRRAFDALVDRIAASLQRDGVEPGEAVSVCASTSLEYAALYIGILRAGGATAPIAPSVTGEQMAAMIADSAARLAFLDSGTAETLGDRRADLSAGIIALDGSEIGMPFEDWLEPEGADAGSG